jgi:preprotein translocase subunit YajC
MDLHYLKPFLAAADAGTTQAPNPQAELMKMIGTFVIFGVIFYFVLIRPQQKRAKQQAEMLKSVKAGDKVVTTGGVVGVIVTVKEKIITLRSSDAKMEITKSAIAEILERAGGSSSES